MKHDRNDKATEVQMLFWIFVWVMVVMGGGHALGIEHTWVYCLVVPFFFLMGGDSVKDKILTIVCGGIVGMLITVVMCLGVLNLSPVLGDIWGWIVPVGIAVALLMLLMPFAPKFFNNVGFSYLIAACIEPEVFCGDILMMLVRFLIGGAIYLGGTLVVVKLFSLYQARKAGASAVPPASQTSPQ